MTQHEKEVAELYVLAGIDDEQVWLLTGKYPNEMPQEWQDFCKEYAAKYEAYLNEMRNK